MLRFLIPLLIVGLVGAGCAKEKEKEPSFGQAYVICKDNSLAKDAESCPKEMIDASPIMVTVKLKEPECTFDPAVIHRGNDYPCSEYQKAVYTTQISLQEFVDLILNDLRYSPASTLTSSTPARLE